MKRDKSDCLDLTIVMFELNRQQKHAGLKAYLRTD